MEVLKYFEVALSETDADDCDAIWICIRGTEQPTIEEANLFMARDVEKVGMPVVGVFPIDKDYAEGCYDFSREAEWPVFSKGE